MRCPDCRTVNADYHRFCHACGASLDRNGVQPADSPQHLPTSDPNVTTDTDSLSAAVMAGGERKVATVMFSDLSGYTTMSETLDPEDVSEIMARIFGVIADIVLSYGGTILKLIGDSALIAFGIPRTQEDAPVRAIRAALEIHNAIERLGVELKPVIGCTLSMHTGINTGLVVTESGTPDGRSPEITGDTVNVAARLEGLAASGDILVGPATYRLARSHFDFQKLPATFVKGKSAPIRIYRVGQPVRAPVRADGGSTFQSALIGRDKELEQMVRIVERLQRRGRGAVMAVVGEAGAGKSRLIAECRTRMNGADAVWMAGNAYAYSRKHSYALFTDLLRRFFKIDESLSPASVRDRIKAALASLGLSAMHLPVVGGLLAADDFTNRQLDPENNKAKLFSAVEQLLDAISDRQATVICLEDLHWVDPSSAELIRYLLSRPALPFVMVLLLRPCSKKLVPQTVLDTPDLFFRFDLKALSVDQMLALATDLLKADRIPSELAAFIRSKTDGNPFYLEEVVGSLIESGLLTAGKSGWELKGTSAFTDIPPTIQGVIAGRLDRLDHRMRRVLQEAAVVGRIFYFQILKTISIHADRLETCLNTLQLRDLIRIYARDNEIEYVFKHALTQEVVYNGLLKKERKVIHDRIARVMEHLFGDRLPEYYEALAFHYAAADTRDKAIEYLIKSGEKNLQRYALVESHRHFQKAFVLLSRDVSDGSIENRCLLIDLINQWAFVFYYRGRYQQLLELLCRHEAMAKDLNDRRRLGMLRAWLGCALWHRERFAEAYRQLTSARALGLKDSGERIYGYAGCWLVWVCTELGMMKEALDLSDEACRAYRRGRVDAYVYVNALAGKGYAYWHMGQIEKVHAVGSQLLAYANENADKRAAVMGHCCRGWAHLLEEDLEQAALYFNRAQASSTDPWYGMFPRLALCYGLISGGQYRQAENLIEKIVAFSSERGAEFAGAPANFFKGVLLCAKGQMVEGIRVLETQLEHWRRCGCKLRYAVCGPMLASIYAGIGRKPELADCGSFMGDLEFLIRIAPFAAKKASGCFRNFAAAAEKIGARVVAGQTYLNWGAFYRSKNRPQRARDCFQSAAACFEACRADRYLKQAREALQSLEHTF